MTTYSMDYDKGKFVSSKDTGINVQPNTLYYWGSYVWPSIVYTTRIVDDNVYYIYVVDNGRWHTEHECRDQVDHFKLHVYSAEQNVKHAIADYDPNHYYCLEANAVWMNNHNHFEISAQYETWEAWGKRIDQENKIRAAEKAKVQRIEITEVTKIVKRRLTEKFPGVKFSVRKSHTSIRVTWIDGPTYDQVNELVGSYHGASFDGMQDLESYHDSTDPETGNPVHYANHYIFFDRDYSAQGIETVWQNLSTQYDLKDAKLVIVDRDYTPGTAYYKIENDFVLFRGGRDTIQDELRQALYTHSFVVVQPEKEKTPEKSNSGVVFGEYKGHATITLPYGDKGFSFGVNKAKAIVEYLAEIQKFIEENS